MREHGEANFLERALVAHGQVPVHVSRIESAQEVYAGIHVTSLPIRRMDQRPSWPNARRHE
jgi:hypothetical protein